MEICSQCDHKDEKKDMFLSYMTGVELWYCPEHWEELNGEEDSSLKVKRVKIKGTHRNSFRPDKWALITNIVMGYPEGLEKRLCYECLYEDGFIDYIPIDITTPANYEIKELG